MNTIKIITNKQNSLLLFHGKSLSLLTVDKETVDLNNLLKSNNGILELKYNEQFQEYLNSIPKTIVSNTDEILAQDLGSIVLPVASNCNLTCPYCFAKPDGKNMNFKDFTEKDVDRLLLVIKKKKQSGKLHIAFFGGEPLLRTDIMRYTIEQAPKVCSNIDMVYSVTTNGTLITPKTAKFLKDNDISVLLSIDGYDNEYNYRKFKNGKSSVDRVLNSIEILKKEEVPFEIRATLTSDNPYIYETFLFLEQLEVPFTLTFAYDSENKTHKDLTHYNSLSFLRIKDAFEKLFQYYRDKIKAKEPFQNKLIWDYFSILENRTRQEYSCAAGRTYHTIMADGSMYSCAHLMNEKECALGNISDWPFGTETEALSFMPAKIDEIENCHDCWAQQLCHGGCASQKYSMGRTAWQPYIKEKCELDKIVYEFIIKLYYEYIRT